MQIILVLNELFALNVLFALKYILLIFSVYLCIQGGPCNGCHDF